MGNTLNYNYNSAITNKNSNLASQKPFSMDVDLFLSHNDQKASIGKDKTKFIYIVSFIIHVI